MKKFVLICLCVLLIGCNPDISGKWSDSGGMTELIFEDGKVNFFGVEGSYELKNKKIIMSLSSVTLEYPYDMKEDQLILYLDDGELVLERITK